MEHLDRWSKRFDHLEVMKLKQGGTRKPLLVATDQAIIRTVIESMRVAGVSVHWRTVRICVRGLFLARGKVLALDRPSKSFCSSLLREKLQMSSHKGTKVTRRDTPGELEDITQKHVLKLAYLVQAGNVPKMLVFNADEQATKLWNASSSTMEAKGAKDVSIKGLGDKRCITITLGSDAEGTMLPIQTIWKGVEGRTGAIPLKKMPTSIKSGMHIQTNNHWQNAHTWLQYAETVLLPRIDATRKRLMKPKQRAVLLLDLSPTHLGPSFRQWAKDNLVDLLWIFPGLTGVLQPMDLAFQGPFKRYIQEHVDATFATSLADHLLSGKPQNSFELALSKSQLEGPFVMALGKAYDRLVGPESLNVRVSGWALASAAWNEDVQRVALEAHAMGALFEYDAQQAVDAVAELAAVAQGASDMEDGDAAEVVAHANELQDGEVGVEIDGAEGESHGASVFGELDSRAAGLSDVDAADEVGDEEGVDMDGDAADDPDSNCEGSDDADNADCVSPTVFVFEKIVQARQASIRRREFRVRHRDLGMDYDKWVTPEQLREAGMEHLIAIFDAGPRQERSKRASTRHD